MKKLLLTLTVPLLAATFLLPQPARAVEDGTVWAQSTFIAQNYLTRAVAASDTLKWTVKSIFDGKVYARKSFEVYGLALFHNFVDVHKQLKAQNLEVASDATFGQSRFDNFWVESKIRRSGGDVYIADGLRVNGDLDLRTASVSTSEITDGAIKAEDLADSYQKEYAQTVIVRAVGTDTQNGILLQNALFGITDSSSSKPYLIKIEPGVYDLGTDILFMKGYVDIEGSGQATTVIRSDTDGSGNTAVVHGFNNSELRNLTVEADGTVADSIGILLSSSDLSIRDVTVNVHSATSYATGIKCINSSPAIQDTIINVDCSTGTGAYGYDTTCATTLRNVNIIAKNASNLNFGISSSGNLAVHGSSISGIDGVASYGINIGISNTLDLTSSVVEGTFGSSDAYAIAGGSTMRIDRSTLKGDDGAIDSDGTIYGGATQFNGTVVGTGSYTCTQSYDGSFALINSSCL